MPMKRRTGAWDTYGVCPCGYRMWAPFGELFHIHRVVCPDCGRPKREWFLKVCRWVYPSRWWKFDGYWEERGEHESAH